eukprot:2622961-Pyramimonas_sp.AAC.1
MNALLASSRLKLGQWPMHLLQCCTAQQATSFAVGLSYACERGRGGRGRKVLQIADRRGLPSPIQAI